MIGPEEINFEKGHKVPTGRNMSAAGEAGCYAEQVTEEACKAGIGTDIGPAGLSISCGCWLPASPAADRYRPGRALEIPRQAFSFQLYSYFNSSLEITIF
jgi:hypothetical protein